MPAVPVAQVVVPPPTALVRPANSAAVAAPAPTAPGMVAQAMQPSPPAATAAATVMPAAAQGVPTAPLTRREVLVGRIGEAQSRSVGNLAGLSQTMGFVNGALSGIGQSLRGSFMLLRGKLS